jgi:hypothetical protein
MLASANSRRPRLKGEQLPFAVNLGRESILAFIAIAVRAMFDRG